MRVDLYTKAVLTVIAIALTIIAFNPWVVPRNAQALTRMDVNIVEVGGHDIIDQSDCIIGRRCPLPVLVVGSY
jgi:hypothetical protein